MLEQGFEVHPVDECLFLKTLENGKRIWVLLFVDDMLRVGDDDGDTCKFIKELTRKYDIQYLGKPKKFLGMRVPYTESGIKLTLDTKTKDLLEQFNMAGAQHTDTPAKEGMSDELYDNEIQKREGMVEEITGFPVREAVGSLLYITMMVRPDICNPVREIRNTKYALSAASCRGSGEGNQKGHEVFNRNARLRLGVPIWASG